VSTKRVLLHVGTPKTGTSYFQEVLFRNRALLAKSGILYPADRFDAHFLAALDLMRMLWGGLEQQAVGAWDALAEQVRAWDGTAIISHEILATASRPQVERALASLGLGDGTEIHLVLSARDLARQIPAEWQENIKHRRTFKYARYLEQIMDPDRTSRAAAWFWGVQELPDILDRWGSDLPPSHVHVVTVPKKGAKSDLLWKRFSEVFGLDGLDGLDLDVERSNPSMGAAETALLRRINLLANKVLDPADYRPLVRELLAHQTLSQRSGSPRLTLPPAVHEWATELATSWVADLEKREYDVVGGLDELLPSPPFKHFADPDKPALIHVNNAAIDVISALLVENARLRQTAEDSSSELSEARAALSATFRAKVRETAVRRLDKTVTGQRALNAVRRSRAQHND